MPDAREFPESQSFRGMEICPSPDELLGVVEERPLRENTGRYLSAEDYLDVHFRLLREDFVRPLREALAAVREALLAARETLAAPPDQDQTSEEAPQTGPKVYTDVRFEGLQEDWFALTITVMISLTQIDVANEKLFMHGSLLCFSATKDNFEHIVLAKVSCCSPNMLKSGRVGVALINSEEILDIKFGASYSMFQSEAHFETYLHVLKALQTMKLDKFPMCKYVTGRTAKIKAIYKGGSICNPGLNAMQFKAYRSALLNDLTVIQGPPGTGKTFLGLKVVKRMIELDKELTKPPPILVICGSNHALDQFLERVVAFCPNLIRVGGQSQSVPLERYNMSAKRTQFRQTFRGANIAQSLKDTRQLMRPLFKAIDQKVQKLNNGFLTVSGEKTLKKTILHLIDQLHEWMNEYQTWKLKGDLEIMRKAQVVGMTTTSATRLSTLLNKLKPSIVIVEEAAAVLEGQIVGALTVHCKQLVLIGKLTKLREVALKYYFLGDHKQLRPMSSCYNIGKKYHLEMSFFERLCKNGVPHVTLNTQHRMRPEFARLLVPSIYHTLHTDDSACHWPGVLGVKKYLYFLTHNYQEEAIGCGKKNAYEAQFLMALCHYLILQGNSPARITVIAMYSAQVEELKSLRAEEVSLKGVLISSVDGYQGEENDIVLLSLVRSNADAQIGFLSTVNRVCVALSRARKGLYVIGNMENLTRDDRSVWCSINKSMLEMNAVGSTLKLKCSVHGLRKHVSYASDFALEEGCGLGCTEDIEFLIKNLSISNKR